MYILMNGKIKVKCITENKYGLSVGKIYDAYTIKSPIKNKNEFISVVDDYGEEYAYPKNIFEIIEEQK